MKTITVQIDVPWSSFFAGSATSLVLHAAMLVLVSMTLRGCRMGSSGEAGGEPAREVGLFLVDGVDGGRSDVGVAPGAGDADVTVQVDEHQGEDSSVDAAASNQSSDRVPTDAPDVSTLLNLSGSDSSNGSGSASSAVPPLIGPGEPFAGIHRPTNGGGDGSRIKSSEAGGAARTGGRGGPGSTTFMNVEGVGQSFVYVIDTSSSMHGSRLKYAQGQLKASLRLLQSNQKFAAIFYNDYRERLQLRRQPNQEMYYATDLNRELAAQEVDRVTCDRGTFHLPAILEALSLEPDVLYLLTDGEPDLSAADLAEILRSKGSTTIHAIRFGDGTMSSRATSWMERLARQAGGEFRDIKAGS